MSKEKKEKESDWVSYSSLTADEKAVLEKQLHNALNAPIPLKVRKAMEALAEWENNEEFLRELQEAIIKNHG